MIFILIYKFWN